MQAPLVQNALLMDFMRGSHSETDWTYAANALSDAEIATNARAVISDHEPGLLAYWALDEAAGTAAFDRSSGGRAHGSLIRVDRVGCTAQIGNPASKVLTLPDCGSAYVSCPPVAIAGKSFTVEAWARRSGAGLTTAQTLLGMGVGNNQQLVFGFRDTGKFTLAFGSNDVETPTAYTDTDWHHFCGTDDQPSKRQRIYCDRVEQQRRRGFRRRCCTASPTSSVPRC